MKVTQRKLPPVNGDISINQVNGLNVGTVTGIQGNPIDLSAAANGVPSLLTLLPGIGFILTPQPQLQNVKYADKLVLTHNGRVVVNRAHEIIFKQG